MSERERERERKERPLETRERHLERVGRCLKGPVLAQAACILAADATSFPSCSRAAHTFLLRAPPFFFSTFVSDGALTFHALAHLRNFFCVHRLHEFAF